MKNNNALEYQRQKNYFIKEKIQILNYAFEESQVKNNYSELTKEEQLEEQNTIMRNYIVGKIFKEKSRSYRSFSPFYPYLKYLLRDAQKEKDKRKLKEYLKKNNHHYIRYL